MNQKHPIIEQYENMNAVEISSDWNDQLFQRIKLKEESFQKSNAPIYAFVGVLLLFALNIFVVFQNVDRFNSNIDKAKYKVVAATFFIQSNSSKF